MDEESKKNSDSAEKMSDMLSEKTVDLNYENESADVQGDENNFSEDYGDNLDDNLIVDNLQAENEENLNKTVIALNMNWVSLFINFVIHY